MRIIELIEEIHVAQLDLELENENKNLIINSYSDKQWSDATDLFLKGVGSNHKIPGNVIYKLMDFVNQFRHNGNLTRDQKWFVLHTMIENWHYVNLMGRLEMNL